MEQSKKRASLKKIKKIIESTFHSSLPTREEVRNEIETNRNHSWFREIIRNKKLADSIFLDLESGISKENFLKKYSKLNYVQFIYLVNNPITKIEYIYESFLLAKALKNKGIKKGDEIILFMDRTPEYAYLFGAASIIGATLNLVCEKFQRDFLIERVIKAKDWHSKLTCDQIISAKKRGIKEPEGPEYEKFLEELNLKQEHKNKIIFIQDTKVLKIKDIIDECKNYEFILCPFQRSAPNTISYKKYIEDFYSSEYDAKLNTLNLTLYDTFIEKGRDYHGKVEVESVLDDNFTITYSSGTTGEPKGIVHSNRHYITMGRYHDSEISGIPSIGTLSTYSNIPSYSNSYISSVLSDNIIIGGLIMLDPVDCMEYFKIGLEINGANMNIASCSAWELLGLNYFSNPIDFKDYNLKNALFNFAVGEEFQPGTEKMCNSFLKKVKAGRHFSTQKLKITSPIPLARMSVAGGSCETGSIYLRMFRSVYSKITKRENKTFPIGMSTYNFVEQKILREDGSEANPYEVGRLVLNSDCTMKYYKNNPEATESFFIYDKNGKKWVDMKVYAYMDEYGNVSIKDRISKSLEEQIEYKIADEIAKDTKNICSVVVVKVYTGEYVAHIIFQPNVKENKEKILIESLKRVRKLYKKISLFFVEHNSKNYFPLTKSLKKDNREMILQGYKNAILIEETPNLKKQKTY